MQIGERFRGMMIGFAVGDALGAPVAGLPARLVAQTTGPLSHFVANRGHPLLGHLKPGQYTENTVLLVQAAHDDLQTRGFSRQQRSQSLYRWATALEDDPSRGRWPGPTTLNSALSLGRMTEHVRHSLSIGACYRVPPLVAFYADDDGLFEAVRDEVRLTHDSAESIAAGAIFGFVLSRCLHGMRPREAIQASITAAHERIGPNPVIERCAMAAAFDGDLVSLRLMTGTGARATETLPLALALAGRFPSDFNSAVISAANSIRPDAVNPIHKARTLEQDIQEVNGGNTDGIAAIAGCIIGTFVGLKGIGQHWQTVESFDVLCAVADTLARHVEFGAKAA